MNLYILSLGQQLLTLCPQHRTIHAIKEAWRKIILKFLLCKWQSRPVEKNTVGDSQLTLPLPAFLNPRFRNFTMSSETLPIQN